MDSVVETRVLGYCRNDLGYDVWPCQTILKCVRDLARASGYDLNEKFARAGLGAGPEGRIASAIVERALGGSSPDTPEYTIRMHVRDWLRTNPSGF